MTAASCSWRRSKSPMTAAMRCNRSSAAGPLRLERLGAGSDRYGRLVAFAFAGEAQQSLQAAMLEQGQARVSARIGDKACADSLLTIEHTARAAHRGLWADPNFAPLQAENLARLQAERRSFRAGRRQGLVGARKRGHYICQLRAA